LGKKKKIQKAGDLHEAFDEKVRRIAKLRGLSPHGAQYLTALLIEKTRHEPVPHTLFDMYREALEAEGLLSGQRYRRLGDQALFVLGVHPESIRRKGVSASYYRDMGSIAYDSASVLIKAPVYSELASSFTPAAFTLREVFEEFRHEACTDVLALYEEWTRTGSLRALRRLQELGFNFQPRVVK